MGTLEAGAGQGQGEHLQGGTDSTGRHGGSWSSGGHGGAGSSGGHGWTASVALALASSQPLQPEPYYPLKKILGAFGALHGLDSGTGSPLGLNIGTGALCGLSTGTGAPSWARLGS